MKNMTFKEKFLFIFLQIITLGLIWIYWNKKTKQYREENVLSQEIKVGVNINKLLNLIGGKENIKDISNTHTKVKIEYKERDKIQINEIKNLSGISGVFMNDLSITIIVGNSAKALNEAIKNNLESI